MLKKLFDLHPALRLAVAESLTGGNVQARVTAESGASNFFVGGVTAYTLEQKVSLLGVDRAKAEASDCVSAEVARQMARGACNLMKCRIAIATTGYAEANPAKGVNVPHAHWAVCHLPGRGKPVFRDGYGEFPGSDREIVQSRVSDEVLAALAKYLKAM
jgi:nicotinamide-nucleotide amidase